MIYLFQNLSRTSGLISDLPDLKPLSVLRWFLLREHQLVVLTFLPISSSHHSSEQLRLDCRKTSSSWGTVQTQTKPFWHPLNKSEEEKLH